MNALHIIGIGLLFSIATSIATAQAQTLDYTAVVTAVDGTAGTLAPGSIVAGTLSFDYALANPTQSSGSVGDQNAAWQSAAYGGAAYALNPVNLLFSDTLNGGGFSFATIANANSTEGVVNGYPVSELFMIATVFDQTGNGVSSALTFSDGAALPAYSTSGLPIDGIPGNGYVQVFSNYGSTITTQVDFNITSVALATPEPSTYAILLVGMVILLTVRRFRKIPVQMTA